MLHSIRDSQKLGSIVGASKNRKRHVLAVAVSCLCAVVDLESVDLDDYISLADHTDVIIIIDIEESTRLQLRPTTHCYTCFSGEITMIP